MVHLISNEKKGIFIIIKFFFCYIWTRKIQQFIILFRWIEKPCLLVTVSNNLSLKTDLIQWMRITVDMVISINGNKMCCNGIIFFFWRNCNEIIKHMGKLQLTHLWFDRNLSCLPVIWNLTLYSPEVSSVRFL